MPLNVLTDAGIRTSKVISAKKLFDGGGLYLLVKPNGARLWRLKYRYGGVEKLLALGSYPEISLRRAREKRDEARQLLDRHIDPSAHRKAQRRAEKLNRDDTLTTVAEEWFSHYIDERAKSNKPLAEKTIEKIRWLLNLPSYQLRPSRTPHPLRLLSDRAIQSITRDEIADVVNSLKRRNKIETAHRMLHALQRVFRYAVGTGRMQHNPATAFADSADPRDKLPPVNHEHHPGLTDPRDVGGLLRATDSYVGEVTTGAALRLSAYVFVRPIEMRKAQWQDIDLDAKEPTWRIPSRNTKQRMPHIVPLALQAVVILRELHQLTGPKGLVFPQIKDSTRPISENSVTSALRRMGYSGEQHTWHGYRTTASTLLRELGWESELVERQLGHQVGNDSGQAYDRSTRLPERREMMHAWADYLDEIKVGHEVVAGKRYQGSGSTKRPRVQG